MRARLGASDKAGSRNKNFVLQVGELFLHADQWIQFEATVDGKERTRGWAQPDLLLRSSERLWIFEAKLRRSNRAWQQLVQLYMPLLRHVFPRLEVSLVHVYSSFGDPSSIHEAESLNEVLEEPRPAANLLWRSR